MMGERSGGKSLGRVSKVKREKFSDGKNPLVKTTGGAPNAGWHERG